LDDFDIRRIAVGFFAIVISITVHEFAHAWMADRLGDDTPRRHGRLSLNPLVIMQAHPVGALIAPLLGAWSGFLIGWASTPVNYSRVRRGITVRKAALLISAAGPISNALLAVISTALFVGLVAVRARAGAADWQEPLLQLTFYLVVANVLLALFNMMPVPPLDGSTVLATVLPRKYAGVMKFLHQYSLILFMLIIYAGGSIFGPVLERVQIGLIQLGQSVSGA